MQKHACAQQVLPQQTPASNNGWSSLQGADFIECDVTLTSDCNLVCRHEPLLSGTTNADELFHDRATTYDIDQQKYEVRYMCEPAFIVPALISGAKFKLDSAWDSGRCHL